MGHTSCRDRSIFPYTYSLSVDSCREKSPRPYGPAVHETSKNTSFQIGYIERTKIVSGKEYILILLKDYPNCYYIFLFPEALLEMMLMILLFAVRVLVSQVVLNLMTW